MTIPQVVAFDGHSGGVRTGSLESHLQLLWKFGLGLCQAAAMSVRLGVVSVVGCWISERRESWWPLLVSLRDPINQYTTKCSLVLDRQDYQPATHLCREMLVSSEHQRNTHDKSHQMPFGRRDIDQGEVFEESSEGYGGVGSLSRPCRKRGADSWPMTFDT